MKKISYLLIVPAFLFACSGSGTTEGNSTEDSLNVEVIDTVQEVEVIPEAPKSPRKQASGAIAGVQVDVDFGSPYVRERVIWGELVPYDKVWRAGANDATAISFGNDVMIDGKAVPAGTYALFIIPQAAPANWTVVLNEEWSKEVHGVWGAYDHKPEKDIIRFDVTPEFGETIQESMIFEVGDEAVTFKWEKGTFSFSLKAK